MLKPSTNLKSRRTTTYIILTGILLFGYYWWSLTIHWSGNVELHTLMEMAGSLLAWLVGSTALIYYYTNKQMTFLFISTGFLGTALLDSYHTLLTANLFINAFPILHSELIAWSWNISRLFLSFWLCLSGLNWHREQRPGTLGKFSEFQVIGLAVVVLLFNFLALLFTPIPPAYYSWFEFQRPQELMAASLFFLALMSYWYKGHWQTDVFEHGLMLSLIVNLVVQTLVMPSSTQPFDHWFILAHLLKIISYILILGGLLASIFVSFKELVAYQEFLRLVLDNIPQRVFWKNGQSVYLGANRRFLEFTQLPDATAIVGKTDWDLPWRDQAEYLQQLDRQVMSANSPAYNTELQWSAAAEAGKTYWSINNQIPLHDIDGKVIGVLITSEDITERKQAEVRLKEYNCHLEQEVEKRTQQLLEKTTTAELAKRDADLANKSKSTFLANMSHELRTPLNGILGYAQILQLDNTLTTEQREGVEIILRSGEYLLTLIEDLLDISRMEIQQVNLYLTVFDFHRFLNNIAEIFQVRATQKGISFIYEPLSYLPKGVYTDEKRLRQILVNLLSNAVKFTKQGGVVLKVGYHLGKIRFQIEDTGIGIASHDLDKIFLPFQQAGDPHYRPEGTGLGLALTKRLVEVMGGELHVESTLGHGTTFWVAIPLADQSDQLPNQEELPVIIGFAPPPRQILVVDDKWENRMVLVNLLSPLGFKVSQADNGAHCLEVALQCHPDAIITDLVMPVMDGFELTRQLRKQPEFKNTVVIAASASVFNLDHRESLEAGCNDFIPKPFRAEVLLGLLQKHLGLTWIYQKSVESEPTSEALTMVTEAESVLGPTKEQATRLLEWSMQGDLDNLTDTLNQFEQQDAQFSPFADKIRQLAKNYELDQIDRLLEKYLN